MEVDDAIQLMGIIESQNDGTPSSAERVDRLNDALIKAPENFSNAYWAEWNPPSEQTRELFAKGVVKEESTWAVLKQISEKEDDA
jgi:hypothetical protein